MTIAERSDVGCNYEMGGTWVSHAQPFLLREMLRYDMDRDLIKTRTEGEANDYYTFKIPGKHLSQDVFDFIADVLI